LLPSRAQACLRGAVTRSVEAPFSTVPAYMQTLDSLLKKRSDFAESPLPQAHFLERQLAHPSAEWAEGARMLREALPKETRIERPHPWYQLLLATHAPGKVIPGNGPFFVPDWVFSVEEREEKEAALKSAGFKETFAHVVFLPSDGEYLASAMRAALIDPYEGAAPRFHPWNANPRTYRAYLYPRLSGLAKRPLRDFTVERARRRF
jgi:hypothetical protein